MKKMLIAGAILLLTTITLHFNVESDNYTPVPDAKLTKTKAQRWIVQPNSFAIKTLSPLPFAQLI